MFYLRNYASGYAVQESITSCVLWNNRIYAGTYATAPLTRSAVISCDDLTGTWTALADPFYTGGQGTSAFSYNHPVVLNNEL